MRRALKGGTCCLCRGGRRGFAYMGKGSGLGPVSLVSPDWECDHLMRILTPRCSSTSLASGGASCANLVNQGSTAACNAHRVDELHKRKYGNGKEHLSDCSCKTKVRHNLRHRLTRFLIDYSQPRAERGCMRRTEGSALIFTTV